MKIDLGVLPKTGADVEEECLKEYYSSWRAFNKSKKEPFAPIFKAFKEEYLHTKKGLSGGALRLYIYLVFVSDNDTGITFRGIERMAKELGVEERTINNWIKELADKDLIYRAHRDIKSSYTHLLPYDLTLINLKPTKVFRKESQELVDNLINKVKKYRDIYGDITGIYHIFHWGKKLKKGSKPKADITKSIQWLLIMTKRQNGISVAHYYQIKHLKKMGVSEIDIDQPLIFDSILEYNHKPITGIALSIDHDLDEKKFDREKLNEGLVKLLTDLSKVTDEYFKTEDKIEYGKISEILDDVLEEQEEGDDERDSKDSDNTEEEKKEN